jgi:hypothetical protein
MRRAPPHVSDATVNTLAVLPGVSLFVSPWVLGFTTDGTASWNAWSTGVAMVLVALPQPRAGKAWIALLLGAWAVVSPWILGFSDLRTATGACYIAGTGAAVLAVAKLWQLHGRPPNGHSAPADQARIGPTRMQPVCPDNDP